MVGYKKKINVIMRRHMIKHTSVFGALSIEEVRSYMGKNIANAPSMGLKD
jgi:hypothetical protein